MGSFELSPKLDFLQQEYLLVQAWKKAHDYIRRHNWYSDVLKLDLTNADLEARLNAIANEMSASEPLLSNPLRLVLAPKSQAWQIRADKWLPTKGPASAAKRLRPLAHLTVRDQIISTAFMILLADNIETRQGEPRVSAKHGRERRMVSYGHRLFCDAENGELRFRWGSSAVYRQYFQDYQAFVSRPQAIVAEVFGDKTDWAIIYADLSQFYDRVRPDALAKKVQAILGDEADADFMAAFGSFFRWKWDPADATEARNYASDADPPIDGYDEVALPQGLVASGFFSNAYLLDFDEAICEGFDQWHENGAWQLVDYCRYVDDMRIVIRLSDQLQNATEATVAQIVSRHLACVLSSHAEGMLLKTEKSTVVLGRNAAAGSIRVSATMKRINENTSGVIDLFLGQETIDLIEGLFFSRDEDPLSFEHKFRDTFFAAKPDVRDETVARFAANRFRLTYRSLRPLCEDNPADSNMSLLPAVSRDFLDGKALQFSRRLIERWVRDPSNMRLLRVALDVCPDVKALEVVLELLEQYVGVGKRRKAPRRVAWYCAAELLKAGATETGLVSDADCLPAGIDLKAYQERLAEFAAQIVERRSTYPWYLEQQAHLYLACAGRSVGRTTTNSALANYTRFHHALAGNGDKLRQNDVAPFVFLQSHHRGTHEAARTFLACFRNSGAPTQRKLLLRVVQENEPLAEEIRRQMSIDERETWGHLYHLHGIMSDGGFPTTRDALPTNATDFAFLSVARSAINPFHQEYMALQFARALLKQLQAEAGLVFPGRLRIRARNWRDLCSDRFPVRADDLTVVLESADEDDVRFAIPDWVRIEDKWKYQLGQTLRVLLTGVPDFTMATPRIDRARSHVLYSPYISSWLRRRYGLYNGRSAFGPPWLPISSWLGSLISRLLEWPGHAPFDAEFDLADDFNAPQLLWLIEKRIEELEGRYGRASRLPVLPIAAPKEFNGHAPFEAPPDPVLLHSLRIAVVQTVVPGANVFEGDPELNNPVVRRRHRRHLSAVLGAVHRMLQVRETHCESGAGIDLLVFPELAIHPIDVRSHVVPFVLQHHCMVFAGMVFHRPAPPQPLINSALWILPVRTSRGGLRVEYIEQGKANLTPDELAMGIAPFRPAQWILQLLHPAQQRPVWSMSGAVCYDSTDLALAADLRNLTDMFVIPALNRDVGTFDNMAAALHYHMFQHVIVANCGEYGGSTGQAPFSDRHSRTIFHTHGNEQVSISFFEVDMNTYRNANPPLKTPPAGWVAANRT